MKCHESKWSPSGIYCCEDESKCIVSEEHIPSCPGKSKQCVRELGGGYCPPGTTCSPNGCLEIVEKDFQGKGLISNQTIGHPHPNETSSQALGDQLSVTNGSLTRRNQTENAPAVDPRPRINITFPEPNQAAQKIETETFTPTKPPQQTFTSVKFGEVAYVSSARPIVAIPSSTSWVWIALSMWMIRRV